VEVFEGPEVRLLDKIFRLRAVVRQPEPEVVQRVEVNQRRVLELVLPGLRGSPENPRLLLRILRRRKVTKLATTLRPSPRREGVELMTLFFSTA
jgi:hypothetical protein